MDTRYENLRLQAANRRHKLLDALSLHKLNRDAYIVDSWINEKVGTIDPAISIIGYLELRPVYLAFSPPVIYCFVSRTLIIWNKFCFSCMFEIKEDCSVLL